MGGAAESSTSVFLCISWALCLFRARMCAPAAFDKTIRRMKRVTRAERAKKEEREREREAKGRREGREDKRPLKPGGRREARAVRGDDRWSRILKVSGRSRDRAQTGFGAFLLEEMREKGAREAASVCVREAQRDGLWRTDRRAKLASMVLGPGSQQNVCSRVHACVCEMERAFWVGRSMGSLCA